MSKKDYGYIYFMSNQYLTTFYVGITSDLKRRIYEHKNKIINGFTEKYNLMKFLYFEKYNSIIDAIDREKQIKKNKIYEVPIVKCAIADLDRNDGNRGKESFNSYTVADLDHNEEKDINKHSSIHIQCPAKINLTLKVVGKRPDGFHNIESIMQTISLYDYLTIKTESAKETSIELSGNSKEIPYNEKNLVYKAAKLFFDSVKIKPHKVSIFIEKNIPIAAGLAGGSTDAAGTLFGLNEIFQKPLNLKQLHELCSQLGSDLNVCLEGGRLMTQGRGEIIEPMEFEEFNLSLIKPKNLGISAKEAYTKFSGKKDKNFKSEYGNREDFKNDLEWAIIDDYSELQKIKKLYPNSMMSGSGSTYFEISGNFEHIEGYEIYNNLKSIKKGVKIC